MGEHPRADRARRIIDILGFTPDPYRTPEEMLSRANLLTELHRHNILKEVPTEIAAIFKCLEQVRFPHTRCQAATLLQHIAPPRHTSLLLYRLWPCLVPAIWVSLTSLAAYVTPAPTLASSSKSWVM